MTRPGAHGAGRTGEPGRRQATVSLLTGAAPEARTGPRGRRVAAAGLLLTTACGGATGGGPGTGVTALPDDAGAPATSPCPEPGDPGGGAGAELPDVTLPCLGRSTELSLRELPAVPVVLTFWASWCAICREEMPRLQQIADESGAQVLFLGVDVEDGERQARFLLDDLGVTWPNLYDETGRTLDLLPSPGVPTTLVLAPDGEILDKAIGAMDQERLRELLTDRLGVRLAVPTAD